MVTSECLTLSKNNNLNYDMISMILLSISSVLKEVKEITWCKVRDIHLRTATAVKKSK